MPYSSVKDVPDYVPAENRKQWLEVFNSAYAAATKDGKSEKEAEEHAFAEANGVAGPNAKSLLAFYKAAITDKPKLADDGLFEDTGTYDETLEAVRRATFTELFQYADQHSGAPGTFDPEGNYLCGDCNRLDRQVYCVSVQGNDISAESGSCRHWTQIAAGQPELRLAEKLTKEQAGYSVTTRPGFGCRRCEYGAKAKEADGQGRGLFCRQGAFRVSGAACCALNDSDALTVFVGNQPVEKARGGKAMLTKTFRKFIPFSKVDAAQRQVWGIVTAEVPDKDDEVCDYLGSKPYYQAVIDEMTKATEGKNFFPLRAMHQLVAAGKCVGFEFRDSDKEIFMGFKVVDDEEWKKVDEGVYTGFSQGGSIVGDMKPDPVFKGCMRYVADPSEVSLVDNPCLGVAHFTYVKTDGTVEMRKIQKMEVGAVVPADRFLSNSRLDDLIESARILKTKANATATPINNPAVKTKRVAGEDLPASAFAFTGNKADGGNPSEWEFPIKFSDPAKTKAYVRRAIVGFDRRKLNIGTTKPFEAILAAAKENGIDPAAEKARYLAVQERLRTRARVAVNKLRRTQGDVGHSLTFLDSNLGQLNKGLYEAGQLACLIQEMGYMLFCIVSEQEWEKDADSPLPAMLEDNVNDLLDSLVAMVAEESDELRDDLAARVHPATA
jgi:hypothetical protein